MKWCPMCHSKNVSVIADCFQSTQTRKNKTMPELKNPEDAIPSPKAVHDRLNILWSKQATSLLLDCIQKLATSQHVGASVTVPINTPDAAVARVTKALEKKGWTAKRVQDSDIRDQSSSDYLTIATASNWQPCTD